MADKVIGFKFKFDIDGFNTSMSKVEKSFSGLDAKLKTTSEKMKGTSDKFKDTGEKISKVGAGFAGLGVTAVASSTTIGNAVSKMNASLVTTGAEAKANEKSLKKLAKSGVGDFETIGAAITGVKQNLGDLKGQELEDMSKQAIQLADLFDMDVNDILKTSGIMMKNFGISGSEAFDLITIGQKKGLNVNDEMLDTFSEYSVQFANMGLDSEQMVNTLISGMEEGSFSVDKVADSMKEFGLIAKEGSEETALAYEALGLNSGEMVKAFGEGGEASANAMTAVVSALANVEDGTEKNKLGVALFGTQWEDTGGKVIESLGLSEDKLGDFNGLAKETAKSSESIGDKFKGAMNTIMISLEPLGTAILPLIEEYLPKIIEKVTALTNWFNNLSEGQKDLVVKLGGLIIIAGPIITAIGSIIGIVSAAMTAITAISAVLVGFGITAGVATAIAIGAFALIPLAIVGILAVFILWGDNIKAFFSKTFKWLGDFLSKNGLNIFLAITNPVGLILKFIVDNWDKIVNVTKKVFPKILDIIVNNLKASVNMVTSLGSKMLEVLIFPFTSAYNLISGIFNKILGLFNVKFKFPKFEMPKMPHFSLTGSFSLAPPSVPKLGVDWYKTGGIATGPSVVGIGESGTEAILPLSNKQYMQPLAATIAGFINNADKGQKSTQEASRIVEIKGNTFVIREEADIKRIAKALLDLEKEEERLNGL